MTRHVSNDASPRSLGSSAVGRRVGPPDSSVTAVSSGGLSNHAADRRRATAWAVEVRDDPLTVYLDTETTGLDATAEVVDVAVIGSDGRVLLNTLIRPSRAIPPEASRIHGIFEADVADAPSWQDIYGELHNVLRERRVVVYNAAFDRRMIHQCCQQHALRQPPAFWECAMHHYARFRGMTSTTGRGYRWIKLEQAVVAFGARPGGHRALADAIACRHVVMGMADVVSAW